MTDQADTQRVFMQYELEPLNFSGRVEVAASIAEDVEFNLKSSRSGCLT